MSQYIYILTGSSAIQKSLEMQNVLLSSDKIILECKNKSKQIERIELILNLLLDEHPKLKDEIGQLDVIDILKGSKI